MLNIQAGALAAVLGDSASNAHNASGVPDSLLMNSVPTIPDYVSPSVTRTCM
jgi:hypothetical protein